MRSTGHPLPPWVVPHSSLGEWPGSDRSFRNAQNDPDPL